MLQAGRLLARPPVIRQANWSAHSTVLYNLGIGFGSAAADDAKFLPWIMEEAPSAFPTMVTVMARDTAWFEDPAYGIDSRNLLHGTQSIDVLHEVPPFGLFTAKDTIDAIADKGAGRPAVIETSRELANENGKVFARCGAGLVVRGAGGFGGEPGPSPQPAALPNRQPDAVFTARTLPEQALIYRLSGDLNPLHFDPEAASKAGFRRPILMGLCTFGIAGRILVEGLCQGDARCLRHLSVRFAGIVYPGDRIDFNVWETGRKTFGFQARTQEQGIVLDSGLIVLDY